MSRTHEGKLVYTMPSLADMFNGVTLNEFRSFSEVDLVVHVKNLMTNETLSCAGGCKISYSWDYTTWVSYIFPPVIYEGMHMTAMMSMQSSGAYYNDPTGESPRLTPRIDGTRMEYGDYEYGNTYHASRRN